jgi:hypothetical protein
MIKLIATLKAHKFLYAGITLCLLVISIPIIYVGNDYRLSNKYDNALNQLRVGDPEQNVVTLMGQPDERAWCYPLPTDHDSLEQKQFHESCVQQYCYYTFLQRYTVTLDRNNRVSDKNRVVSP